MSALGMDDAEFFISVNPGEPPKPLGTTVSGGELSRILLAIKTVLADKEDTPTLILMRSTPASVESQLERWRKNCISSDRSVR